MFTARFILLLLTWVVLSGQFDPLHLSLGVAASLLVAWISREVAWEDPSPSPRRGLRHFRNLLGYLGWLLGQIVQANLHVFRLAFQPIEALDPRIVRFRTRLKKDFSRFVLATSITLTPGTITVRLEGDEFVVHAISERMARGLPGEMEERVARVFEEAD